MHELLQLSIEITQLVLEKQFPTHLTFVEHDEDAKNAGTSKKQVLICYETSTCDVGIMTCYGGFVARILILIFLFIYPHFQMTRQLRVSSFRTRLQRASWKLSTEFLIACTKANCQLYDDGPPFCYSLCRSGRFDVSYTVEVT